MHGGAGADRSGLDDAGHMTESFFDVGMASKERLDVRGLPTAALDRAHNRHPHGHGSGLVLSARWKTGTLRWSFARYHPGFGRNGVMLENLVGGLVLTLDQGSGIVTMNSRLPAWLA